MTGSCRMLVLSIRMFRMLLVCYPYVLVWCFSHDPVDPNSMKYIT